MQSFEGFVSPDLKVYPSKTKITTLPNGVRIASTTGPANPRATIGLYIDSGSVYETPKTFGVSRLLECIAFNTTTNRSQLRIVEEIKETCATLAVFDSREQMGYVIDGLKIHLPTMVDLLIDSVRNHAFLDEQVQNHLGEFNSIIKEDSNDPQKVLMEALHSTGYSGALANPHLPLKSALYRLNSKTLKNFVAKNYIAPRMILSAVGVEHEDLLSIAEPLLSDMPAVPRPEEPKSVYVGGDYRCKAGSESEITHFALAFEAPGGRLNRKEAVTLAVLQILLGVDHSSSSCEDENGRCTRLCSRMQKDPQIQAFSALSSPFYKTSLFGIQATTRSEFASEAVEIAVKELIAVATPGDVKQEELDYFKARYKTVFLMYFESRLVASELIAKEVSAFGERIPVEHHLKAIDEVTTDDIASVCSKLMSSPLTMASYGDVRNVPSYDQVTSMLRSL